MTYGTLLPLIDDETLHFPTIVKEEGGAVSSVVPPVITSEAEGRSDTADCGATPTDKSVTTTASGRRTSVVHTNKSEEKEKKVPIENEEKDNAVDIEDEVEEETERTPESRVNIVALLALFGALIAVTLVVLVFISIRRGKQGR